jgi:hypothetical protein
MISGHDMRHLLLGQQTACNSYATRVELTIPNKVGGKAGSGAVGDASGADLGLPLLRHPHHRRPLHHYSHHPQHQIPVNLVVVVRI